MDTILAWLSSTIIEVIEATGYTGIIFLMALESANIPVPSEVVVPFSGFLAQRGAFTFWGVVMAASFGNLLGSWLSYEVALRGGAAALAHYGKYLFITKDDLGYANALFRRFGSGIILIGRVLPVVRTFISFAAGIGGMNRARFLLYTFIGSIPWNVALTYIGFRAGEEWFVVGPYFRAFDWLIALLAVSGIVWWVWRHLARIRVRSEN